MKIKFIKYFLELENAKKAGFKIAAHVGETKDSVNQAAGELLKLTDRIGHGTHLINDSRLFYASG